MHAQVGLLGQVYGCCIMVDPDSRESNFKSIFCFIEFKNKHHTRIVIVISGVTNFKLMFIIC